MHASTIVTRVRELVDEEGLELDQALARVCAELGAPEATRKLAGRILAAFSGKPQPKRPPALRIVMGLPDTSACRGCREDYYNQHPEQAIGGRCCHADTAHITTRYRIAFDVAPTVPGAYSAVSVPSCYHQPGKAAYHAELPHFVDLERVKWGPHPGELS